jgi:hypothetical protein
MRSTHQNPGKTLILYPVEGGQHAPDYPAAFSVSDGRSGMTDEEMEEMKRGNGETVKRGDEETTEK